MLKSYHSHMRVKPHKNIMFRDGVSEDQFQHVSTLISSIQKCKFLTFIKKQATQHCVKSIFIRIFVVHVFPHSDRVWKDTEYLSVFSPNAQKQGPEKLRKQTLFTRCNCSCQNEMIRRKNPANL